MQRFKPGLEGRKDANLNGEESSCRRAVEEDPERTWKTLNARLEVFSFF